MMMASSKTELRKLMAGVVSRLTQSEKETQSKAVLAKVLQHQKFKQAKSVSIYLSTQNEIDTIELLRHTLEEAKKECFVPFVRKTRGAGADPDSSEPRMVMVEVKCLSQYEEMPRNRYGIKEPKEDSAASLRSAKPERDDLDVIIVPGVAFSLAGQRLGHGKGYYDEFLADWRRRSPKPLYSIGVAFREQIVANPLAQDGHDYRLDEVLVA